MDNENIKEKYGSLEIIVQTQSKILSTAWSLEHHPVQFQKPQNASSKASKLMFL